MPQERQQWVFAPFRLDPGNARLWRDTEAVALPPKAFAVLDHLVRHAGRLVTKEDLLDAVWQRRFVSESVLKGCINELRKALGDDPKSPRYIATVSRRGYRFIAEVKEVGSSGDGRGEHDEAVATPEREAHPEAAYWVGREGPLSRLQGILQSALEAQPQLVFIPGEAGIGKTTLVEMFIERLSDRRVDVLWGQCIDQYGAGEAFLPLLQALGKRCRASGGEAFVAKLRHYAPTWLAQMPWTLAGEEREALQREVLGATKERMLRELCEALEALGRETPLLLILEDLHWSDHATLDFISLLARRRERAALVVIGTYRPVEIILRGHPLKSVKQEPPDARPVLRAGTRGARCFRTSWPTWRGGSRPVRSRRSWRRSSTGERKAIPSSWSTWSNISSPKGASPKSGAPGPCVPGIRGSMPRCRRACGR